MNIRISRINRPNRTETGRPVMLAYLFSLALIVTVVALKHFVNTPLGNDAPFLFMLGSTMLVTWYGGRWAGLTASVLGTLAVNYFFLPPYDDWHSTPAANEQTVLFGAENLLVAWLTSLLVRARARAEVGADRMRRMYVLNSATTAARTVGDVARLVAREGVKVMGAATASVFLAEGAPPVLRVAARSGKEGASASDMPAETPLPVTTAFRTRELVCDGSIMCAPLVIGGGTLGVFVVEYDHDRKHTPDERVLCTTLAQDCVRAMDRVRLFDAEHDMRLQAEKANLAKDEFLGIVSHELRTPLTAISGWVYLLKRTSDPERRQHALDVIERGVKAQSRIVEDILDVQRIVGHKVKIERETVDFTAAVRSVVDEVQPVAIARGIELTSTSGGEVYVTGDAERLRQVARNLVGNAIKFTPRGGHVRVEVEVAQARARLRVRDDGKGVAEEDISSVFEIFRQADSSTTRREGGLGLGLAIVRSLVEAHGGAVRLESPGLGLGTTAVVELPLLEVREQAHEPADPASTPTLAGLRLLVVDDDPGALESISAILADAGAEVRQARSAAAALEELSGFEPDVLVSDISMPDRDGYWLIRKVRSLGTLSARVPAIALTAYGSAERAKVASLLAGYQRHLTKPAEPAVLAGAIVELARRVA